MKRPRAIPPMRKVSIAKRALEFCAEADVIAAGDEEGGRGAEVDEIIHDGVDFDPPPRCLFPTARKVKGRFEGVKKLLS